MRNLHLALLLCLMVAIESTTIKWVTISQKNVPPAEQLILLIEIAKLLVCGVVYKIQTFFKQEGTAAPVKSTIWWFMIPAFLYAISNNITFKALETLSPPMFNLLMNLKIPLTGLLAAGFLGYVITPALGASFVMLFVGSAVACVTWDNGIQLDASPIGILLMLVYALCSASAAVYTEYVTKVRFADENMFLQNVKYCFCGVIINSVVIVFRRAPLFQFIEPIHAASILALTMNGLVTAAVLKYGGSILKTYSVSVAMFLAALFSYIIWRTVLHWNFYVGASVCAVAVNLYARGRQRVTAVRTPPEENESLLPQSD